jgi:hypothetical protein
MYIQLPVFLMEDEPEDEILRKKTEPKELLLSFNPCKVVSHWQGFDGYTHFTLDDTREHISNIEYTDFIDLLQECTVSVELDVSDN